MTNQDIASVADGLTEAQRAAISSCFQDAPRHAPYHMFANTAVNRRAFRSFIPAGFVASEDDGFDLVVTRGRPLASVVLTPLGLAVRQYLKDTRNDQ